MIYYLFIDGVGFGENNPKINPFTRFAKSFFIPLGGNQIPFDSIFSKGLYLKTDAHMGISGLPQSATGQTALWTGINAPKVLNRHVSAYPSFTLKKIISEHSILKVLKDHGKKVSFLNCYTPIFFEKMMKNKRFLSASTLIQLATKEPFKNLDDLRNERGLFMDITHEILRSFAKEFIDQNDPLLQLRDPFLMGQKSVSMGSDYDLVLFEYFITDKIGHSMDWDYAQKVIQIVEEFIEGIVSCLQPNDLLIVTSDHGNLEDLSHKIHTNNLVPTFLFGKDIKEFSTQINSLCDIPLAIYKRLGINYIPEYNKEEDDANE
jgi:hypothetical protein